MQNVYHSELIKNAINISTFKGFELTNSKNLQTSNISLKFKFSRDEEVEILCNYHGNFISLKASTINLLNSNLLRFIEIKKELGLS